MPETKKKTFYTIPRLASSLSHLWTCIFKFRNLLLHYLCESKRSSHRFVVWHLYCFHYILVVSMVMFRSLTIPFDVLRSPYSVWGHTSLSPSPSTPHYLLTVYGDAQVSHHLPHLTISWQCLVMPKSLTTSFHASLSPNNIWWHPSISPSPEIVQDAPNSNIVLGMDNGIKPIYLLRTYVNWVVPGNCLAAEVTGAGQVTGGQVTWGQVGRESVQSQQSEPGLTILRYYDTFD